MICDTTFLQEQCDQDMEMVQTMVEMFISTAPGYLERINTAFLNENFTEVKDAAHGFLSSLKIMGASEIVEITKKVEDNIMNRVFDDIESLIGQVDSLTKKAIQELKEIKK
jgi:HPt (histidine-containing phosphotransfer) domain-containing protein